MSTQVIEVSGLVKTYHQAGTPIEVLRGIDLSIEEGEMVAIIGQSGSGKSTLLSLLAGLDRPTSGRVLIAGQDINSKSESELSRFRARQMGIVFQQFHLMSYLTALENVNLPLEILKLDRSEELAKTALRQVGLEKRFNHLPSQLSGGEKQRVAIARAMGVRPRILLADEPSGNLDARTGQEVMQLLFDQTQSLKMAMILVTHNEDLAKRCDRILVLTDGRLVNQDGPDGN